MNNEENERFAEGKRVRPLKNPRHEKFARCRVEGLSYPKAYRKAFPNDRSKQTTCNANGYKLAHRPDVDERIEYLKHKSAMSAVMTAHEKRTILADIARITPADYTDIDGNVDLEKIKALKGVKALKISTAENRKGEAVTKVDLVLSDTLNAIKIDNEMTGDNAPIAVEVSEASAKQSIKELLANMSPQERLAWIKQRKADNADDSSDVQEAEIDTSWFNGVSEEE